MYRVSLFGNTKNAMAGLVTVSMPLNYVFHQHLYLHTLSLRHVHHWKVHIL
jgi:hypothetical protein